MSPDPLEETETVSLEELDRYSVSDEYQNQPAQSSFRLKKSPIMFTLSLQLFLSFMLGSILSSTLTFQIIGKLGCVRSEARCGPGMSQYSPVMKETDARYWTIYFNGSFMNENVYRRTGSPEVDAAWASLGIDYRAAVISEEEGKASGLSEHHVQRAKLYGGGFFVNVEGLHHLHCLNIIRKSLYFNYDYYLAIKDESLQGNPEIVKFHVTHCLDTLRQLLMCHAETGVLGQLWVRQSNTKSPQAFPDFNTRHICKDYETMRKWAEKHQVPPNQKIPTGYVAAPEEPHILPSIP